MEGRFEGERGIGIYYQTWIATGKPKAILALAHGQGEHSGRYVHVAEYMTRMGYAVWACDFRGHGRSGGNRGHTDSFDDYLADIRRLIQIAKDGDPKAKTFLLGHSLGGLIALDYAEKPGSELAGLVVTAPPLRVKMKVPSWKTSLGKILSSIRPTFSMKTGLDPNLLSRDREVVKKYVEDPLVHGIATARFYTELLRAQDETVRAAEKLTLPCLIVQGGADGIVDPPATSDFFKRVASPDKTLKVYDGFYHEVLNEPGKESVLRDIDAWISGRS